VDASPSLMSMKRGTLENHPVGHQHYFMTKKLDYVE
jgi:hypothetical protein